MTQHYTRNTLEITHYCRKCGKNTQHYVWGGRLGNCKEDHHKDKPVKPKPEESKQENLFK